MSHPIKVKILKELDVITKEVERISKQFSVFNSPLAMITENIWRPPTDVYETSEKIVIKMEIAGIKSEDLDVKLIGRTLIIAGDRHDECEDQKITYKLMEINFGHFEKMIPIPENIAVDDVYAFYNNGFLEIGLPKKDQLEILININCETGDTNKND